MNRGLYAIHDRIANELTGMRMYLIMVFRTDQEAARYFADAINDKSSILNKHPADYALVKLGELTQEPNGEIISAAYGSYQLVVTGDVLVSDNQLSLLKEA